MTAFVALLRAVNVGGTGILRMSDLRATCQAAGFCGVRTYLASGNAVFRSDEPAATVARTLAARLQEHSGRPIAVILRSAGEMRAARDANPFPDLDPRRTYAAFVDQRLGPDALDGMSGLDDELVAIGTREIYVHYPPGIGRSRLRIPAARDGTMRNMRTVAALAAMASEDEG